MANFKLLANTSGTGTTETVTSGAIDTRGADLIVIGISYNTGAVPTVVDSLGNTWTALTAHIVAANGTSQLYYCRNPITGAAQTFSNTGASGFSTITVQAWFGSFSTPFEIENGANNAAAATLATGAVSPAQSGELVVSHFMFSVAGTASVDSNLTISNQQNFVAGTSYGGALAYLIQNPKDSINPTWTSGGGATGIAASIAVFRFAPFGTTTSTSSTSISSTSISSTSTSYSSTSSSTSISSTSVSSTSTSLSTSSTSSSISSTSSSTSSTSSSTSSTSSSSTSSSTSVSSTSTSISSTSHSSTSQSSTSSSTSLSSTSSSFSSTSSSISSTSASTSSTSFSSTSSSSSTSTTAIPLNLDYTYQDTLTLPTTGADDIDLDTSKNYQNVGADDADYFIQYGSEYMIQEYKRKDTNATDAPSFTYKGRTTQDTRTSPLLIQIYNQGNLVSGTADSYSETNASASVSTSSARSIIGQSFTGDGGILSTAKFYIGWSGTADTAKAQVYSHSGVFGTSSAALALLATSDNLSSAAITPGPSQGLSTFTFSGSNKITLTNGTKYVTVVSCNGNPIASTISVGYDNTSPTHAGNYYDDSTGADSTADVCFYITTQTGTSPAWETLATINTIPADTDFQITVKQTTNVSNYYDTNNIVTFRTYQQVI